MESYQSNAIWLFEESERQIRKKKMSAIFTARDECVWKLETCFIIGLDNETKLAINLMAYNDFGFLKLIFCF